MRPTHSLEQKKSNSLNRTAKVYSSDMAFPLQEEAYDDYDDGDDIVEGDSIHPSSATLPSTITDDLNATNKSSAPEASCDTCTCCRKCYDRLSKEFNQKVEDVYERCCAKFGHDHDGSNSDSLDHHAKLARTASSVSQKSTCSSGYGGSMYDPPIYIEPTITEESRQAALTPDTDALMLKLPEAANDMYTRRGSNISTASYHTSPSSPTTSTM